MKILQLFKYKKLLAATARRASAASAGMDFGDIPEPNMRLSRALLIVLLLHVVAVSGIIAFNAIKTRQSSFVSSGPDNNPAAIPIGATINSDASNPRSAVTQKETLPRDQAKTQRSVSKPLAKDELVKSSDRGKSPAPSGKVYTVIKGDNTVTI